MYKPQFVNKDRFYGRYHAFDQFKADKNFNKKVHLDLIEPKQRLPIDQYSSQEFALSDHGWPLSDVALLAKAQTQQELDLALSRLRELGLTGVNNEGKSVAQVLHEVVPRWCQTPAELQRYAQYYTTWFDPSSVSDETDDPKDKKDDESST